MGPTWPARPTGKKAHRTAPSTGGASHCTSTSAKDRQAAPLPASTSRSASGFSSLNDDGLSASPVYRCNPEIEHSSPSEKSYIPKKSNPEPSKNVVLNSGSSAGPVLRCCSSQDKTLGQPKSPAAGVATGGSGVEGSIGGVSLTAIEVEAKGGDEASAQIDTAVIEGGGSTKVGERRTRKVVKKTVRIVKKIVKRRVPKRVVKSSVAEEESTGIENGGHTEMTELGADEVEKADSDGVVEKMDSNFTVGNEEMEGLVDDGSFREKDESLRPGLNELNAVEVGKVVHSDAFSMESDETSKPNDTFALEVEEEDWKEMQGKAIVMTKIKSSTESIVKVEDMEELEDSRSGSLSQGLVAKKNDGKDSLMVEDQLEGENVKFVRTKTDHCFEDLSTGDIKDRKSDREEVVKEKLEKNDVGMNDGLAFSGEMEALERRKRRRTEVFIGGLDKDTKEEDIKKLFEQVGEVKQVTLVMKNNSSTKKGFAFLRFASAADAKKALEQYSTVEISGKQCSVKLVEGNDTLYLGNINRKWKSKDLVELLKVAKIQNIDNVLVMANPNNFEENRGFAFIEFQTTRDAQIAFSKLEKYDVFVKQMKIKVSWAQPIVEPDEEEMLKVKTIFAEYLPSSWDEAKARDFFKKFGEIKSISLANNIHSSRRKDFAFVNYTTREAALACLGAFTHEQVDNTGSKVNVKVSLARPLKKVKQTKHLSRTSGKERAEEKRMASQSVIKFHEPIEKGKHVSSNLEGIGVDGASTTVELLQLLRQQARVGQPRLGSSELNHQYAPAGSKRPFSALVQGIHPLSLEPRGLPHSQSGTSYTYGSSSRLGMVHLPNTQQHPTRDTLESPLGFEKDPYSKAREQAAYFGRGGGGMYRRY